MKKYIYKVQDVKLKRYRDYHSHFEDYVYWSEEKYVLANSRKDAMKLIFDKENTKQIKLITCLKFTNAYDMISAMIENVEVDNSSPILLIMDKWGRHYVRPINDIKRLVFTYINRFKGTMHIHHLKDSYLYKDIYNELRSE